MIYHTVLVSSITFDSWHPQRMVLIGFVPDFVLSLNVASAIRRPTNVHIPCRINAQGHSSLAAWLAWLQITPPAHQREKGAILTLDQSAHQSLILQIASCLPTTAQD